MPHIALLSCPSCTCCRVASWPFLCMISNCACFKLSQIEELCELVAPLGLQHCVSYNASIRLAGLELWLCCSPVSQQVVFHETRCASTAAWFLRMCCKELLKPRQGSNPEVLLVTCFWSLVGTDTASHLRPLQGWYDFWGKLMLRLLLGDPLHLSQLQWV